MRKPFLRGKYILPVLLAPFILLNNCVSLPSDNDHDHDHDHEAVGLNIYSLNPAGDKDALVLSQTFAGIEGEVILHDTEEFFTFYFTDDDDHEFIPDLDEHTVEIEISSGADNLELTQLDSASEDLNFSLKGLKTGSSTLTVLLKHQGSREFVSKPIPVTVTL